MFAQSPARGKNYGPFRIADGEADVQPSLLPGHSTTPGAECQVLFLPFSFLCQEYPMQIQGYGAGASVTAAGVFANIMSIANI